MIPDRKRLANRREQFTETLVIGNGAYIASVGFDHELPGSPLREVFLEGAKAGSDMAHLLADVATFVSIALQHGLPASLFAPSMARVPETIDGPATRPASALGAAIDLVARYEAENPE